MRKKRELCSSKRGHEQLMIKDTGYESMCNTRNERAYQAFKAKPYYMGEKEQEDITRWNQQALNL